MQEQQLDRLRRHLASFLEYDWDGGAARSYVGVERGFGYDTPLSVKAGKTELYVHGFIDRLDLEDGKTLVRDLKTGKSRSRSVDPMDPRLDVQLALYGMVVARLSKEWKVPRKVAAAYVYTDAAEPERAFRDDFAELEKAARGWLEVAANLLLARDFPRTTDAKDCGYCAFLAVCGGDAAARSARLLNDAGPGAAQAFGELRTGDAK